MKHFIIKWASKLGNGNLFFTAIGFVLWACLYITELLRIDPFILDERKPLVFLYALALFSLDLTLTISLISGAMYILLRILSFLILLTNQELKETTAREEKDAILVKYRKRLSKACIIFSLIASMIWLFVFFAAMWFENRPDWQELGIILVYPVILLYCVGMPAMICGTGALLIRLYSWLKPKLLASSRIRMSYVKYSLYITSLIFQILAYKYILHYLWV